MPATNLTVLRATLGRYAKMKLRMKQVSIKEIQKRLCTLEMKYGMTSAEFGQKYRRGEMGDSEEVMM